MAEEDIDPQTIKGGQLTEVHVVLEQRSARRGDFEGSLQVENRGADWEKVE